MNPLEGLLFQDLIQEPLLEVSRANMAPNLASSWPPRRPQVGAMSGPCWLLKRVLSKMLKKKPPKRTRMRIKKDLETENLQSATPVSKKRLSRRFMNTENLQSASISRPSWPPKWSQHGLQKPSENGSKSYHFLVRFGSPLGALLEPSWSPLGALLASKIFSTWPPKAAQKRARNVSF